MNGYEIGEFKNSLIRKIIDSSEARELLDPNGSCEYPDELLYKYIFPYGRIPETEEEVGTYIAIKVHVPSIGARNDTIRNVRIEIRIYAHHDLMKVKGKSVDRIDMLSAVVDKLINETMDFGIGPLRLESNTEHVLDSKHSFREMFFRTDAINSKRDGVRQWEQS